MRSTGAVVQPGEGGENARKEGRTLVFGSCKWLYSYRRFLYQGGTHYVFFEVRSGRVLRGGWCIGSRTRRSATRSAHLWALAL